MGRSLYVTSCFKRHDKAISETIYNIRLRVLVGVYIVSNTYTKDSRVSLSPHPFYFQIFSEMKSQLFRIDVISKETYSVLNTKAPTIKISMRYYSFGLTEALKKPKCRQQMIDEGFACKVVIMVSGRRAIRLM